MSDDSKLQKKHIKTQGSVCTHAHRLENSNHQHLRWIVQWKCDLGTERGNRHAFDDLSFWVCAWGGGPATQVVAERLSFPMSLEVARGDVLFSKGE